MTSWQIALGVGGLVVLVGLWAAQRSKHPFDIRDVLMDPATGKASLNSLLIAMMGGLSIWLVVDRELGGGRPDDGVAALLPTILGVFVGGRVLAQGISAYKATQPGPTTVTESRSITIPPPGATDIDDAVAPAPAPATSKSKNK